MRVVATALVGAISVAACTAGPTTPMRLENLTDIPVAVHVNGAWIGTYPAGASTDVPLPGRPPLGVEVFSPSGAQLAEAAVPGDALEGGWVELFEVHCGSLRLSAGPLELPSFEPLQTLGPCP